MPDTPLGPEVGASVDRAASMLSDSLLGVVAYGSRMRGDHTPASDADILVVADARVAITRDLYRKWDAKPPLAWDGHRVEPIFAQLPSPQR